MMENGAPQLSDDEWAIYECLKNSMEDKTSLQEFFGNVHEKITSNVAEKHMIASQS